MAPSSSWGCKQPIESFAAVGEVAGAVALGFQVEDEALGEMLFVFHEDNKGSGHGRSLVGRNSMFA